jgi:hypothetical protein
MDVQEKMRENRLREAAKRQGLELHKSRLRDPRALGYDTWNVVDTKALKSFTLMAFIPLDDVERFLMEGDV